MSYVKHQVGVRPYPIELYGNVNLPEECTWRVMKYLGEGEGEGHFSSELEDAGEICLSLEDKWEAKKGFWPVMSFFTPDEALELAKQLQEAANSMGEIVHADRSI